MRMINSKHQGTIQRILYSRRKTSGNLKKKRVSKLYKNTSILVLFPKLFKQRLYAFPRPSSVLQRYIAKFIV